METLADIGEESWSRLSGADKREGGTYNPFVSYAFLSALEESGSALPETGWIGSHIAVRNGSGTLEAAMPAYLKMHSYGEYVFDHAGPMPMSVPAGATIPSSSQAFPSRRPARRNS